ncbi:MAG: hypothetical protein CML13_12855 [Puniceicoccaceae bacterium]|nr:hypothetical protein [Puniceicoccaceae bacterium]|tara:strand:- start:159 stop:911 length:753 start_codon:yes stop_codon:yes gene_type:complete
MKMILRIATLCGLYLFINSPLHAAEKEYPTIQSQLTILCWDDEIELSYPGYDGDEAIIAPMQARSAPIEYSGPNRILLSRIIENVAPELPPMSHPAAEVIIPPSYAQALIILIPQNQSGAPYPYRPIVVNDSLEHFPKQSLRFLNFTEHQLAGQLGAKQFKIEPKSEAVSKPDKTLGSKHLVPFRIVRRIAGQDTWRPVKSTAFSMPPYARILVLILEDPQAPDLRFVILKELSNLSEALPEEAGTVERD